MQGTYLKVEKKKSTFIKSSKITPKIIYLKKKKNEGMHSQIGLSNVTKVHASAISINT